jgi:hypothetical protein
MEITRRSGTWKEVVRIKKIPGWEDPTRDVEEGIR